MACSEGPFSLERLPMARLPRFVSWFAVPALALSGFVSLPAAASPRLTQTCTPQWLSTFGPRPGVGAKTIVETVEDMARFDEGHGPDLFVGGYFTSAGGDPASAFLSRWNGEDWSAVGGGVDGPVRALLVTDDLGGPALYAGGSFTTAGGVPCSSIARWDGNEWSALGSGVSGEVRSLAIWDDGAGPALYAGGTFTAAGGLPANRIARWDGSQWSPLGLGIDVGPRVSALAVYDEGNGPRLFAGGFIASAGGTPMRGVARWDGTNWSNVGGNVGQPGWVDSLEVFDDGSGPALFIGGQFGSVGGIQANDIARWNGTSWASLGSMVPGGGTIGSVFDMVGFDDGHGPALFAGGAIYSADGLTAGRLARWDGNAWSAPASPLGTEVYALAVHDDGHGPALLVGGGFLEADGLAVDHIASWTPAGWRPLGEGLDQKVLALTYHDEGAGPVLFAGGDFTTAGRQLAAHVARHDGSGWTPLGSGVDDDVLSLTVFDDGSGPALHAGGRFLTAGGAPAARVARWNGASWASLGAGMTGSPNDRVSALCVFDEGAGPRLFAGGQFLTAGGNPASNVARWDGTTWSPLGAGVAGPVSAMAVFDDGNGPGLYVAGDFAIAGGQAANRIARWTGLDWEPLGAGRASEVWSLAVFDDGAGPALYVGASFVTPDFQSADALSRWKGGVWELIDPFLNVMAMTTHDDGSGLQLVLGGNGIRRWDGSILSVLGTGFSGSVLCLASNPGVAPELVAGGSFGFAGPTRDGYVARWALDDTPPEIACRPVNALVGPGSATGKIVHFTVAVSDDTDPAPLVFNTPPSGSFFPLGTTMVTCQAVDACGNEATCQFPVTVTSKAALVPDRRRP
jgi:hypothetical protein